MMTVKNDFYIRCNNCGYVTTVNADSLEFYVFLSIASLGVTLLFLSFILPSNYSLGVNAGFAAMIIMVILLIILGIWSKLTNNAIMWFVVEHFELSMVITFVGVAILFVLSYALSVSFFKRKHT